MLITCQGSIEFTEDELKGVPPTVISTYTKSVKDGRELYTVTHLQPDIFPVVSLPTHRAAVWPD